MKTVCIESPLSGDFARNIKYARMALRYCLDHGVSPFASHLLYTQVLNDEVMVHRELGMAAGFAMGDLCDERWFFTDFGMSTGMLMAQRRARDMGQITQDVGLEASQHDIRDLADLVGTPHIEWRTK